MLTHVKMFREEKALKTLD